MHHISQVKNRSPTETMYAVTAPHSESPHSGFSLVKFSQLLSRVRLFAKVPGGFLHVVTFELSFTEG